MGDKVPFSAVKKAREALKERSNEILNKIMETIDMANRSGNHDVAAKTLLHLIDHMPADDEGNRIFEASADKKKTEQAATGPSIQIGFALGGMSPQVALPPPPAVIEVVPIKEEEDVKEK